MPNKKSAVDDSGLCPDQVQALSTQDASLANVVGQGTFGEPRTEAVPKFIQTESEIVFHNKNNAWIVLGRDRPGSRQSGFGGRGDTQCGSIDLVVGRMSYKPDCTMHVDPNVHADAARIYISQKTDIDNNFNIDFGQPPGSKSAKPIVIPRSGIGIKADLVRVIGREGIKLVTGVDTVNAQGAEIKSIQGIDLLAGNNDKLLEPLVKGDRLVEALTKIVDYIENLQNVIAGLTYSQLVTDYYIANHVHAPPGTIPSVELAAGMVLPTLAKVGKTIPSAVIDFVNAAGFKHNYFSNAGPRYINSQSNKTT